MGDIVRFHPPSWPAGQGPVTPISRAALRAQLEEAAQVALDAADRILAALDRIGEDADHVGAGNAETFLDRSRGTGGNVPGGNQTTPDQR